MTDFPSREPALSKPLAEIVEIAQKLTSEGQFVLLGNARALLKEFPATKANHFS